MARSKRNPNFDQTLELLRAHGFQVLRGDTPAALATVVKNGVAAQLAPNNKIPACLATAPGLWIDGSVAGLIDRGFQKFLQTNRHEQPATAAQLQALHDFDQELCLWIGAPVLFNEALGSTSNLCQYDRLKNRQAPQAVAPSPWDSFAH